MSRTRLMGVAGMARNAQPLIVEQIQQFEDRSIPAPGRLDWSPRRLTAGTNAYI